ncbi:MULTISPECIES: hypothetical protein [unclassified Bradyrhizobium]
MLIASALVARGRLRSDLLHDAEINRRIDERLEGMELPRRKDDSRFAKPEAQIEIPPGAARQFLAAMQAYHAEHDALRRDMIAVRTYHMLLEHMPRGSKLPLSKVKELFDQLRSLA